mmetsp:Transcript_26475/g.22666  ORF Transcript_26475/g.22666 Transcript_26475/m.22666 type:complete len:118 (-) Transcript_26475:104-457(-)
MTASPKRRPSRSFDQDYHPSSHCWEYNRRRSISASTVVSDSELPKGAAPTRWSEEPTRRVRFYPRVDLLLYRSTSKVSSGKPCSIPIRDSVPSRKRLLFQRSRASPRITLWNRVHLT